MVNNSKQEVRSKGRVRLNESSIQNSDVDFFHMVALTRDISQELPRVGIKGGSPPE